jgi:hypothetical protein
MILSILHAINDALHFIGCPTTIMLVLNRQFALNFSLLCFSNRSAMHRSHLSLSYSHLYGNYYIIRMAPSKGILNSNT